MAHYASYGDQNNLGVGEPEDMFSHRHYTAVRGDGRQKRALSLWCCTSERFHKTEMETIFLPSWNLLDREEIVPQIGDFRCLTFMSANLLVTRGKDNKVLVFANTCPHRGALVAAEDVERLQPLTLQQAVEKAVEIIKGRQDRLRIGRLRPAILLVFCHRANAISPWPGPASSP